MNDGINELGIFSRPLKKNKAKVGIEKKLERDKIFQSFHRWCLVDVITFHF